MQSPRFVPPSAPAAAVSSGGGCLSGFLIPPLAVLVVGGVLASFVLGGSAPTTGLSSEGFQREFVVQATETLAAVVDNSTSVGEVSAAVLILPAISSEPTLPRPDPVVTGRLSTIFTPEVQYWAVAIQSWATAGGLDPNLVATVMQIESCGDPLARSRSGAMGLFQVMPYHFYSSDNPYDPDTNAARGLAYLKRSLETAGGDNRLALAGYNGGIGVIGRGEFTWAAETVRYAYWGSGIYTEAASGASESLRLQEWLMAGGASLCRQARQRLGISP